MLYKYINGVKNIKGDMMKYREKIIEIEYLKYKYKIALQNYYLEFPNSIMSYKEYKTKYCIFKKKVL